MQFPYGSGQLDIVTGCPHRPDVFTYNDAVEFQDETSYLRHSLCHPISGDRLQELARGRNRAIIIVDDGTFWGAPRTALPALLQELNEGGIDDDRIRIIVAIGANRKHTDRELRQLVGQEAFERVAVINHSSLSEDCSAVGVTQNGFILEINRLVVEADLRITLSAVEPVSGGFGAYTGGLSAVVPGVASRRTIEAWYSFETHGLPTIASNHTDTAPEVSNASFTQSKKENLLDVLQRLLPIDFGIQCIYGHRQQLLAVYSGKWVTAYQMAAAEARERFTVQVHKRYDIVVASPGGAPKDRRLSSVIPSLEHAAALVKSGGSVVLLAECLEQYGDGQFLHAAATVRDRQYIAGVLANHFSYGMHFVGQIESIISRMSVYLYSAIPEPLVELTGFLPIGDVHQLISTIVHNPDCEIAMMPCASLTVPIVIT